MTRKEFKDRVERMREGWGVNDNGRLGLTCFAIDMFVGYSARIDFHSYFKSDWNTWAAAMFHEDRLSRDDEIINSCRIILFELWALNTLDNKKYLEF